MQIIKKYLIDILFQLGIIFLLIEKYDRCGKGLLKPKNCSFEYNGFIGVFLILLSVHILARRIFAYIKIKK